MKRAGVAAATASTILAIAAVGCIRIERPRLEGRYALEGHPGVTLSIDHVTGDDYLYRVCTPQDCDTGAMHVIAPFNGFRGEAEFEGREMEALERDLTMDGGEPGPLAPPDEHSVMSFQSSEADGVTFVADPEHDRRFVPLAPVETDDG